jgi:glycosyltransferase involved in cell wall biosynthesis
MKTFESQKKNPLLIVIPLVVWIVLVFIVVLPWIFQKNDLNKYLPVLALISSIIWWFILLWALHHLTFQIVSLFVKGRETKQGLTPDNSSKPQEILRKHRENLNYLEERAALYGVNIPLEIHNQIEEEKGKIRSIEIDIEEIREEQRNFDLPSIAILYPTCDDFNIRNCQSCLDQDYENFHLFVCDDSKGTRYKELIREFCKNNSPKCSLVTRSSNQGFKAGNLNNAITKYVKEEWILIVDADQLLPSDYLSQFTTVLADIEQHPDIVFFQGAQVTFIDENSSPFQAALALEVPLFYFRDLALRNTYGLVPCLGHGTLIKKDTLEKLGGLPELVSEDFAFTLKALNYGYKGEYLNRIISYEAFPFDFGGFMMRLKKFAGGTAELLQKEALTFLAGKASIIEKWDFFMSVLWYALMPLVTLNGFLSAYIVHMLWSQNISYLHPVLPYLYLWLLLTIFAIIVSASHKFSTAFKFYFWSTAVYAAAMPPAGLSFIRHFFTKPSFERTPKNNEKGKLNTFDRIFMIILGIAAILYSSIWLSPFSPVLLGQGIAYISYPLYDNLSVKSSFGIISRLIIYIPGVLMIFAVYAMWKWAKY